MNIKLENCFCEDMKIFFPSPDMRADALTEFTFSKLAKKRLF